MKYPFFILALFVQLTWAPKILLSQQPYFPPAAAWERKTPASVGVDGMKLKEAIEFAKTNETKMPRNLELTQVYNFGKEPFSDGVGPFAERKASSGLIIYKGYIIGEWGDVFFSEQVNSVSKSFLSTLVGLAVEKGLINNIHDKVEPYVPMIEPYESETYRKAEDLGKPQFLLPFAVPHNSKITWDHLLRQTSDWEGTLWGKPDWADRPNDKTAEWINRPRNEPGTVYKYNDTRVNVLALATTAVWHRPLPEVLREYIMEPIGASNQWHWTGYRNSWIVMDGKLMQSVSGGGHFGGGLFISAIDMARFGLLTLHKGKWGNKQLIPEQWMDLSTRPTTAEPEYGFMNYFLNTDQKLFPAAPASAFAHIGNGTNMIYVDREHELVIVGRWIENKSLNDFLQRVLQAVQQKK
jgi:CubicO group peptidase (beta-lactamase class C family)